MNTPDLQRRDRGSPTRGSAPLPSLARFAGPTVVEVSAPHCSACRAMKPDLDQVAAAFSGEVDLVPIDAVQQPELVSELRVLGTPTLIGVKRGSEVYRITGRRSSAELEELFASLINDRPIPLAGRTGTALQVGAGVVLTGLGLVMGPAWPLVVIGVAVEVYAGSRWMKKA